MLESTFMQNVFVVAPKMLLSSQAIKYVESSGQGI